MRRKLVSQGHSTLTISLPSRWIKQFSLKGGDEVEINEQGPKVVISAESEEALQKGTIDTARLGDFEKNYLSDMYHLGYDEIEIIFDDSETLEEIRKKLQDCIGFEIVDQSEKRIVIKSLTKSVAKEEFDNILRKVWLNLLGMAEGVHDALSKKEFSRLKELRLLEDVNNKFVDFCMRVLNKHGYPHDPKKTASMYALIEYLEIIGDEYKFICQYFGETKNQKLSKNSLALLNEINEHLRMFYELFYKFDKDKASLMLKERQTLTQSSEKLLEAKSVPDVRMAHHLLSIMGLMREIKNTYSEVIF